MKGHSAGFTVVEIVIAAAFVLAVTGGAAGAWQLYLKLANSSSQNIAAALLIDEGSDAVGLLRDSSWNSAIASLSLNIPYYLYWDGTKYVTTQTKTLIQGQYVRTMTLRSVMRDPSSYNIVQSGGAVDPSTRDVTIAISLASSTNPIASSEMLIHDVFGN